MKHISILIPNGDNNLSSIVGTYKILNRANEYWQRHYKERKYNIQLVGASENIDFHNGIFSAKPQVLIHQLKSTNLIVIPSLNHQFEEGVKLNSEIIKWIGKQYEKGSEVASICTGAFLLAETGLLNGRKCSTHWSASNIFRTKYPEVDIQSDRLITDEHGIYTNGGAYSFLQLVIYLVEKYFDKSTALYCSKVFQIDLDRQNQSMFRIFEGQKSHKDEMVIKAQTFIETHLSDKISMEQLSSQLNVSRRNFDRRFIKATGNTPIEYSQRVKIESVKKSLETTDKLINELMYEVGYSDTKAFREVFKKITGLSPLEYKQKFGKQSHSFRD